MKKHGVIVLGVVYIFVSAIACQQSGDSVRQESDLKATTTYKSIYCNAKDGRTYILKSQLNIDATVYGRTDPDNRFTFMIRSTTPKKIQTYSTQLICGVRMREVQLLWPLPPVSQVFESITCKNNNSNEALAGLTIFRWSEAEGGLYDAYSYTKMPPVVKDPGVPGVDVAKLKCNFAE